MKIRPVILCGGAGTRLWNNFKNYKAKQFIDFGNWTLIGKTLERVKDPIFDIPIISTNKTYLKLTKKFLKKHNIKNFKIVLEPQKKNTAPAILSSILIKDIPNNQPVIFFSADQRIEKVNILKKALKKIKKKLSDKNIFIFGIKPKNPSIHYGYLIPKIKSTKNQFTVKRFIEKPNVKKAKEIIRKNGYWNSGIFFIRKDSVINNFKKLQPKIYKNCLKATDYSKYQKNIYYLNKNFFSKMPSLSFDYAILEKLKNINAVKLNLPWSDLGSWREICNFYNKNKKYYFNKKNIFYRPWGKYINLFKGENFLIKELQINYKGTLSLQKHHHRSEHWVIIDGKPKVTLNNRTYKLKPGDYIFIPVGSIHRVENTFKKKVKIIEAQIGSILKETDIVRYKDIYGRIN